MAGRARVCRGSTMAAGLREGLLGVSVDSFTAGGKAAGLADGLLFADDVCRGHPATKWQHPADRVGLVDPRDDPAVIECHVIEEACSSGAGIGDMCPPPSTTGG
jgi:hypothetical protein